MKKAINLRLKESSVEELKNLAETYKISQADVIEKLIDFAVITDQDIKAKRGVEIDNIVFSSNVRNLFQSLK